MEVTTARRGLKLVDLSADVLSLITRRLSYDKAVDLVWLSGDTMIYQRCVSQEGVSEMLVDNERSVNFLMPQRDLILPFRHVRSLHVQTPLRRDLSMDWTRLGPSLRTIDFGEAKNSILAFLKEDEKKPGSIDAVMVKDLIPNLARLKVSAEGCRMTPEANLCFLNGLPNTLTALDYKPFNHNVHEFGFGILPHSLLCSLRELRYHIWFAHFARIFLPEYYNPLNMGSSDEEHGLGETDFLIPLLLSRLENLTAIKLGLVDNEPSLDLIKHLPNLLHLDLAFIPANSLSYCRDSTRFISQLPANLTCLVIPIHTRKDLDLIASIVPPSLIHLELENGISLTSPPPSFDSTSLRKLSFARNFWLHISTPFSWKLPKSLTDLAIPVCEQLDTLTFSSLSQLKILRLVNGIFNFSEHSLFSPSSLIILDCFGSIISSSVLLRLSNSLHELICFISLNSLPRHLQTELEDWNYDLGLKILSTHILGHTRTSTPLYYWVNHEFLDSLQYYTRLRSLDIPNVRHNEPLKFPKLCSSLTSLSLCEDPNKSHRSIMFVDTDKVWHPLHPADLPPSLTELNVIGLPWQLPLFVVDGDPSSGLMPDYSLPMSLTSLRASDPVVDMPEVGQHREYPLFLPLLATAPSLHTLELIISPYRRINYNTLLNLIPTTITSFTLGDPGARDVHSKITKSSWPPSLTSLTLFGHVLFWRSLKHLPLSYLNVSILVIDETDLIEAGIVTEESIKLTSWSSSDLHPHLHRLLPGIRTFDRMILRIYDTCRSRR